MFPQAIKSTKTSSCQSNTSKQFKSNSNYTKDPNSITSTDKVYHGWKVSLSYPKVSDFRLWKIELRFGNFWPATNFKELFGIKKKPKQKHPNLKPNKNTTPHPPHIYGERERMFTLVCWHFGFMFLCTTPSKHLFFKLYNILLVIGERDHTSWRGGGLHFCLRHYSDYDIYEGGLLFSKDYWETALKQLHMPLICFGEIKSHSSYSLTQNNWAL